MENQLLVQIVLLAARTITQRRGNNNRFELLVTSWEMACSELGVTM